MSATCGDYGGMTAEGTPCEHDAGWGTDHPGEGRCKDHDEAAIAKMQANKKSFLEIYVQGGLSLAAAAAQLGLNQSTVWRWRQQDPEFDRQCEQAKVTHAAVRMSMIEDSSFRRVVEGEAPASLVMFFLVNYARQAKRPDLFMHAHQIQHALDKGSIEEARAAWADVVAAVEDTGLIEGA